MAADLGEREMWIKKRLQRSRSQFARPTFYCKELGFYQHCHRRHHPKGESSSQEMSIIGVYYSLSAPFRTSIHFSGDRLEDMVEPKSLRSTLPRSRQIGLTVPPHECNTYLAFI
jgi:hypothetical protein